MLTSVTITGADDAVDPSELVQLSERFPFVEWGVLISETRRGEERYPTDEWIWRFARAVGRRPVRSAIHLCGLAARETMAGNCAWLRDMPLCVQRVQINGWDAGLATQLVRAFAGRGLSCVVQARDEIALHAAAKDAWRYLCCRIDCCALFDPSGGVGYAPQFWPLPPRELSVGYAGGIGPDNVREVIETIQLEHTTALGWSPDFWIDMESGGRTDDRLDLEKVRAVLEAAAPFIGTPERRP